MYLKRLKELREDHDLLQKQVAIALKITRQQYGLYENGDRTLPIDKLFILSKLYETSANYILGLTDEIKPYPRITKYFFSPFAQEFDFVKIPNPL